MQYLRFKRATNVTCIGWFLIQAVGGFLETAKRNLNEILGLFKILSRFKFEIN